MEIMDMAMGEHMNRNRHRKEKDGIPAFKVKEADVMNAVFQYMGIMKIPVWRNNTGALRTPGGGFVKFGKKDSADITGIDPKTGRRIEIECKAPGESLRAGQREFLDMINRCCGIGICVHSVEELKEQLKEAEVI
jgi:hypothetical protein